MEMIHETGEITPWSHTDLYGVSQSGSLAVQQPQGHNPADACLCLQLSAFFSQEPMVGLNL